MQAAALAHMGIEGEYRALLVRENEFEECVAHLASSGFIGVNVTIPHKESAAAISEGDEVVKRLGVANTLKFIDGRILARNTDAVGFWAPLANDQYAHALVLGAGGAAIACVYALTENNVKVRIWNRSPERAKELALRFGCDAITEPNPEGCDLVINTTPLGLKPGDVPQLNWQNLQPGSTVYDLAYRNETTDLLMQARNHGSNAIDGREMLVEQGALSLEWWLGKPVPREPMRMAVGL
jgi:shikimate dehydrogenase